MSAKVTVTRSWPTDDGLQVIVRVDTSYPDAVHEAVRSALDAYTEAMGVELAVSDEAGE